MEIVAEIVATAAETEAAIVDHDVPVGAVAEAATAGHAAINADYSLQKCEKDAEKDKIFSASFAFTKMNFPT